MTGRKYADGAATSRRYRQLWERLGRLPGVTAAGGVSSLPLSQMMAWGPITVDGRTPPPGETFINVDQRIVGGDYFRAMEIPLLRGRLFSEQDTPRPHTGRHGRRAHGAADLAERGRHRQAHPHRRDGRRLRTRRGSPSSGVVGRVKQDALDSEPRMAVYFPHSQLSTRAMNVVVRSSASIRRRSPARFATRFARSIAICRSTTCGR